MKKLIIIGFLLTIILALGISAAAQLTATDATFGRDDQRRSNPDADDDEDQNLRITTTLTITANQSISNLSYYSTTVDQNRFNLSVESIDKTTLNPGQSATVTLKATVPEDFDGVNDDLEEAALDMGTVTFGCNQSGVTAVSDLKMQAENQLEIDKVFVKVNDVSKSSISRSGKKIKELRPGDEIELTIRIKNNFDDKDPEDLKLEDVTVKVEESDLDVDEDDEISSINPEEYEDIKLTFEIDEEQDKGDYDLILTAEGEDENGAKHGEKWTIELEVDRENYEIDIRKLTLDPDTIDNCMDRIVDLRVEIKNIGEKDDDEIVIEAKAPGLQYSKKIRDIELDKDDEETKTFRIPVDEDTPAGNYFIEVNTFYKDDEPSHNADIKLTVTKCQITPPAEGEAEAEAEAEGEPELVLTNQTTTGAVVAPIIAGTQPVATVEGGFGGSTLYIGILIVAVVIALLSFSLALILLFKKRTE